MIECEGCRFTLERVETLCGLELYRNVVVGGRRGAALWSIMPHSTNIPFPILQAWRLVGVAGGSRGQGRDEHQSALSDDRCFGKFSCFESNERSRFAESQ